MIKYPGKYSDLCLHKSVTHFWALVNNEVIIFRGKAEQDHTMFFGYGIENVDERGYFVESKGVVTCHGFVDSWLLNKLEKAFDKAGLCAIYLYSSHEIVVSE